MPVQKKTWNHPSVIRFLKEHGADDPVAAVRQVARDLVSEAFDAGWSGPPFDPLQLAALLKIEVLPNDDISEAQLVPVAANQVRIEYNPHERPSRIRFSLSHEIGHTLFSDCEEAVRHRAAKKDANTWELEFLCDVAASEILLPYGVFVQDAKVVSPTIRDLMSLGDRYKASLEAVLLRFAETSEDPCSVIFARFDDPTQVSLSVQYSKGSLGFQPTISRGYAIPRSSKAYECINAGWTSHGREHWRVFNSEYDIECVGLPPTKYDNRPRVGILVSTAGAHFDRPTTSIVPDIGDATQPRGSGNKIIAQLVNSGAAVGTGFGRAMAESWPESAKSLRRWKEETQTFKMGTSRLTKLSPEIYVFQMLAQKGVVPKEGKIGIRYSSLRTCLTELAKAAAQLGASVHMPRIGAGQAGGDWSIIEGMITEELLMKNISVTVYDLPGRAIPKNTSSQPQLFKLV